MSHQVWPVLLVVGAGLADAADRPLLAFYILLAAIPVIVVAALSAYGDVVAGEGGSLGKTVLWTLALLIVIAAVALPSLGNIALIACLVVVGIQGASALSSELRRAPNA